ncbi:hypothetical protein TWF694_006285 [Orbilia ellipsospora]|uniref:Uncharacterized protein n=1 Tax=Orbilia ellipsospora TaxID=2528407 RepID=A0AAV9XK43_9PEZI
MTTYSIVFTNNTAYTFSGICRPPFLLPANFSNCPTTVAPGGSVTLTATGFPNSILFKTTNAAGTLLCDLRIWATADGSGWYAGAGWMQDVDTYVNNPPTDVTIVKGGVGNDIHYVTLNPASPSRLRARNDMLKGEAAALPRPAPRPFRA